MVLLSFLSLLSFSSKMTVSPRARRRGRVDRRRHRAFLWVRGGAQDRASPSYGASQFGARRIGIFCDILFGVLLFSAISGLFFLGRALSRPQVRGRDPPRRLGAAGGGGGGGGRGEAAAPAEVGVGGQGRSPGHREGDGRSFVPSE